MCALQAGVLSYSLGTLIGPLIASSIFEYKGFGWTMVAVAAFVLTGAPVVALCSAHLRHADTPSDHPADDSVARLDAVTSAIHQADGQYQSLRH